MRTWILGWEREGWLRGVKVGEVLKVGVMWGCKWSRVRCLRWGYLKSWGGGSRWVGGRVRVGGGLGDGGGGGRCKGNLGG